MTKIIWVHVILIKSIYHLIYWLNSYTTSPSRGFGSNQVDFGGIVKLLFATSITSSIWVGNIANATLSGLSFTLFSNASNPWQPAINLILSSVLASFIPRIVFKQKLSIILIWK